MTAAGRAAPERLIVFARWPVPGATKTRLIPALGALPAAELQRRMTLRTMDAARRWAGPADRQIEVRHAGGTGRDMRRWLGSGPCYRRQAGEDLGRRMAAAFRSAFDEGCRRPLLIGTDCPGVTPELLDEATAALAERDLVLGPSRDGGYWLIGMARPLPVFHGVQWSTASVLSRTLERARRQGLRVHLLPELSDVDLPADLSHAGGLLEPGRPVISVVIPALNEAGHIEAAVRSADAPGVELIVVDGGSTDGTPERAERLGARVLPSAPGRARQQNAGAAAARAETVLFLHADTLLPDGWQGDVFTALLDPTAAGGGFLWRTDLEGLCMRVARHFVRLRTIYGRQPWGDQAIFARKRAFDAVGGFPDVPLAEDWDFVRSLRRRGRLVAVRREVITSARRWKRVGVVRGFVTNRLILLGCRLGLPRRWLRKLY